jgi:hypothetical protein
LVVARVRATTALGAHHHPDRTMTDARGSGVINRDELAGLPHVGVVRDLE